MNTTIFNFNELPTLIKIKGNNGDFEVFQLNRTKAKLGAFLTKVKPKPNKTIFQNK